MLTTNGSGTVTWSTPSIGFKSVFNDNLGPSYEITDTHNGVIIYENNSLSVSSSLTSGFICDYIYFSNHPGTITASSNILYTKGSNTATNSVSISSGDHIRIMAVAADKVYVTIY